jgi:hypothetical protein
MRFIVPGRISLDAVERILAAVGEEFIPPHLDQQKLALGLGGCKVTYSSAVRRRSDKQTKNRIRRLDSIRKAATRLVDQLLPDAVWRLSDRSEWDLLLSEVKTLIKSLNSEIEDLTFELEWGPDWREEIRQHLPPRALADRWKARSPFEWVAGHYLPELFETHFGIKPTFHRRDKVPNSPVICFIEQALIELGITDSGRAYARESIAKALSDARSGRIRRKLKG